MLSTATPKLLLSPGLVLHRRARPSTSSAGTTSFFTPISSSALPSDINGGNDRTDGGAANLKGGSGGAALRGSDILLAMQRAVARKEGTGGSEGRRSGRKGRKRRGSKGGGVEMNQFLPADLDYENVRPIEIRGDWAQRIDELEQRIQELRSRKIYEDDSCLPSMISEIIPMNSYFSNIMCC